MEFRNHEDNVTSPNEIVLNIGFFPAGNLHG